MDIAQDLELYASRHGAKERLIDLLDSLGQQAPFLVVRGLKLDLLLASQQLLSKHKEGRNSSLVTRNHYELVWQENRAAKLLQSDGGDPIGRWALLFEGSVIHLEEIVKAFKKEQMEEDY